MKGLAGFGMCMNRWRWKPRFCFTKVDNLVILPAWDHAIFFAVYGVAKDKSRFGKGVENS